MSYSSLSPIRTRRGMTLVELLVVALILVMFVAVAAPLLKPATADRKVREASRQLNALIAEARAYAAQRGKPVGLMFDRAMATEEAARDPNIITRFYFAQVPPPYQGDLPTSKMVVWREPGSPTQPTIPGYTPPPINGNAAQLLVLEFRYGGTSENAMLDSLVASYMRNPTPGQKIPFTIRIGGGNYLGVVVYNSPPPPGITGRTYNYFCWAPFGSGLYNDCLNGQIQDLPPPPYPGTVPPSPTAPPPYDRAYSISFPPVPAAGAPLELPTGTVVDLQFSGYGASGSQFFDNTRQATTPLVIVFDPSGDVAVVQDRNSWGVPQGRIHLLVGTQAKAVDTIDAANPANRDPIASNLGDPINQWVSISTRTGNVTTADNLTPTNTAQIDTAIRDARGFATSLTTKGGR